MDRSYFQCIGQATYDGNGNAITTTNGDLVQGFQTGSGRRFSYFWVDMDSVRQELQGQVIDGCFIQLHSTTWRLASGGIGVFGTHAFTAAETSPDLSKVKMNRVRNNVQPNENFTVNLGPSVGAEFANGTTTGLFFGPGDSDADVFSGGFSGVSDTANLPKLVVDHHDIGSENPDAPTLVLPYASEVMDVEHNGVSFIWLPKQPQQAWYFSRLLDTGGAAEWFNVTTGQWQDTPFRITTGNALAAGNIGILGFQIKPGQWENTGHCYYTVASENTAGTISPYAPWRTIYTSTPPEATITSPENNVEVHTKRPVITWDYSDAEGDAQLRWIAGIYKYNPSKPGGIGDVVTYQTGYDSRTSWTCNVDLFNRTQYVAVAQVFSSPNPNDRLQQSSWTYQGHVIRINLQPLPPSIKFPKNGSIIDLAAGFTLEWVNNFEDQNSVQTAFSIRRLVTGATAYQYWDGGTWQDTETFLSGAATAYSFRKNENLNGTEYTYAVSVKNQYNYASEYSKGATVTGSPAAEVSVLDPPSVVTDVQPTVAWSVFDKNGNPQQTYQVRILEESEYINGLADPGAATAIWDSGEIADQYIRAVEVGTPLVNSGNYRAYVRVTTNSVYSGWSYAEFTVTLVPPPAPTVSTIIQQDLAAIDIVIQAHDSMLSGEAGRNESNWVAVSGCDITNNVSFESSMSNIASSVVATATGTMVVKNGTPAPVVADVSYTAAATIVTDPTASAPANGYVSIVFLDAGGALITTADGDPGSDGPAAYRASVTTTSPLNAVQAYMTITYTDVAATGDTHLFFDPVIRPGESSVWTPGGMLGDTFIDVYEVYGKEDADKRTVRRGLRVPIPATSQQVTVRDEEVAIGEMQQYSVQISATYGPNKLASPVALTVPTSWTSGWLWLSDPLSPGSAHSFGPQELGDVTQPAREGIFRPLGRADAVVTRGIRSLREGSYSIVTHTAADTDAYINLVRTTDVALLRIPPDQGDKSGTTVYVKLVGDIPVKRALPSRTPHRVIEQSWIEQNYPPGDMEYVALGASDDDQPVGEVGGQPQPPTIVNDRPGQPVPGGGSSGGGSSEAPPTPPPVTITPITFVGHGSYDVQSNNSIITLYAPASVNPGDLIIAVISCDGLSIPYMTPDGWTVVSQFSYSRSIFVVAYKIYTEDDPSYWSYSVNTYSGAVDIGTGIFAYRNVNKRNPVITSTTKTSATAASYIVSNPLTVSQDNAFLVSVFNFSWVPHTEPSLSADSSLTNRGWNWKECGFFYSYRTQGFWVGDSAGLIAPNVSQSTVGYVYPNYFTAMATQLALRQGGRSTADTPIVAKQGMTKDGDFTDSSGSWVKVTGWALRDGTPAGSISNDELLVNGYGTVKITSSLDGTSTTTAIPAYRVKLNGTVIIGPTSTTDAYNNPNTVPLVRNATAEVEDGDVLELEVLSDTNGVTVDGNSDTYITYEPAGTQ